MARERQNNIKHEPYLEGKRPNLDSVAFSNSLARRSTRGLRQVELVRRSV